MFFQFLNWLAAGQPWHLVLSVVLHFLGIFTGLWIWYIFPKEPARMNSGRRAAPRELEKGQSLLGKDDETEEERVGRNSSRDGEEKGETPEKRRGAKEAGMFKRSQG
ncbi:hypothetical protein niasHS_006799 [Heterodera schachtii]|uniref:Uncharacterized protein n=2 Tax=Heterodera TaxID=34509 RepID=A0ABD2JIB2_HETSC